MLPKMTTKQLIKLINDEFPQSAGLVSNIELEKEFLKLEMPTDNRHLRPGGSVSGPTMFSLADLAMYYLVLLYVGPKTHAVTTNCSIDFMRKPVPGKLIAKAQLLKLGRRLAVGDVLIYSQGLIEPVTHATLTYSLP